MKTYTSIMMLFARSTIYKLVGLLAVSGLVESGLFFMASRGELSLETTFAGSHISLACGIFFLLWTALLTMHAFQHSGYTLQRMSICPRGLFLCHTLYNALCYVIFWGFQVTLLTALFHWFGTQADETMFGPQSIMLAFYRDDFLHSLLPLADWTRYLRNIALAVGMGAAAAMPLLLHGSRSSQLVLLVYALFTLWTFPAAMGGRVGDLLLGLLALAVPGMLTVRAGVHEEAVSGSDSVPEVAVSPVFTEAENEVSRDDE